MTISVPFREFKTVVPAEWIDGNGHMSARFYSLLVFDAHWVFSDAIGLGGAYIRERNLGKNIVEGHMVYERELLEGDRVEVESRLLAVSDKGVHIAHEVFNVDRNYRAAIWEEVDLNVDLTMRRAAPFTPDMRANLEDIARQFAQLPPLDKIGRSVKLFTGRSNKSS
jgi:acyl-CoA thioester hydrolase